MKEKLLFVAKVLALSILLFLLMSRVGAGYVWLVGKIANFIRGLLSARVVELNTAKSLNFLVPFLAAILSASGLSLKYKLKWLSIGLIAFIIFDTVTVATTIPMLAQEYRPARQYLPIGAIAVVIHTTLLRILPFLLLLLALKGKLDLLWTPLIRVVPPSLCPICGKGRTGLVDHIRSVHGEKALKSGKVRRHLVRTGIT